MSDVLITVVVLILGLPYAYLVGRAVGSGFHDSKWNYHQRFLTKYGVYDDANGSDDNQVYEEGKDNGGKIPGAKRSQQWSRSR